MWGEVFGGRVRLDRDGLSCDVSVVASWDFWHLDLSANGRELTLISPAIFMT